MQRMRKFLLTAALLSFMAGIVGAGAAAFQASPTSVAVVDVQHAINSLKEMEQVKADMQGSRDAYKRELAKKEQQVKRLRDQLDHLKAGSDAREAHIDKLEEAVIQFAVWDKIQNRELKRQSADQLERLYRDVNDMVAKIAKENGYDLVLYQKAGINFRFQDGMQLASQIAGRKVLYAEDTIDLTDQVIQRMNNEFEAGQ